MSRMPAAERREQLLDCAAELFARRGYARATTSQLAKAAGVTEPIIYRHFSSKRDLFVALIERAGQRTLEQWEQHLAGAEDPAERLRRLIGDNPMVQSEGRDVYRVFLQAISEVESDEKIAAAVRAHIDNVKAFLERELDNAQRHNRVPKRFSSEVLAWVMINVGMGYGVLSALGLDDHGRDSSGVHVQDVIARAIVVRQPDETGRNRGDNAG